MVGFIPIISDVSVETRLGTEVFVTRVGLTVESTVDGWFDTEGIAEVEVSSESFFIEINIITKSTCIGSISDTIITTSKVRIIEVIRK